VGREWARFDSELYFVYSHSIALHWHIQVEKLRRHIIVYWYYQNKTADSTWIMLGDLHEDAVLSWLDPFISGSLKSFAAQVHDLPAEINEKGHISLWG